jgi:hypothetical protein
MIQAIAYQGIWRGKNSDFCFCFSFLLRVKPVPKAPKASIPNVEVDSGIDLETGSARKT